MEKGKKEESKEGILNESKEERQEGQKRGRIIGVMEEIRVRWMKEKNAGRKENRKADGRKRSMERKMKMTAWNQRRQTGTGEGRKKEISMNAKGTFLYSALCLPSTTVRSHELRHEIIPRDSRSAVNADMTSSRF